MKKIIALAVVSFTVFVLLQAPASLLLPYLNQSPYFQVSHISGNIFAAKMQTTGEFDALTYRLNAWQLLLANLSIDVAVQKDNNQLKGEAAINLITQKITLEHLTGGIDLALLEQYLPELSTVQPRGQLVLNGVNVAWDNLQNNPIPQRLSGNIELLKFQALAQDFGNYTLRLVTKTPSNIIGTIGHQKSAQVSADIKLNLLDKKKQLLISGVVSGNTPNTKEILRQLNVGKIQQTIRY